MCRNRGYEPPGCFDHFFFALCRSYKAVAGHKETLLMCQFVVCDLDDHNRFAIRMQSTHQASSQTL